MKSYELRKMSSGEIATKQHLYLKQHAIKTLNNIVQMIQEEDYDTIEYYLFFSPAGSSHSGMDNLCIEFSYDIDEYNVDIAEIVEKLKQLKNLSKKSNEVE